MAWGWPELALGGMVADFADVHLPKAADHFEGSAAPGTARRAIFSILLLGGCARAAAQGQTCLATIFSTFPATSTDIP